MPTRFERQLLVLSVVAAFCTLLAGQIDSSRLNVASTVNIEPYWLGLGLLLAVFYGPLRRIRSSRPPSSSVPRSWWVSLSVLIITLAASVAWSSDQLGDLGMALRLLALLPILAVLKACLEIDRATVVKTAMTLCVVAGVIFAVAGLASFGGEGRIAAFGGGPNVFARITGLGLIGTIYWVSVKRRGAWLLPLSLPMVAATILSGSRGAMAGVCFALLIIAIGLNRRTLLRAVAGTLVAAPLIGYVYVIYGSVILRSVDERIVKLTIEEGYLSGRGGLWSAAIDMIADRPLQGYGLGTFQNIYGFYPHNLLLDVLVTAGVLGGLALLGLLWASFLGIARSGLRKADVLYPAACSVLIFVSAMFSGALFDSRFLWFFLLLAVSSPLPMEVSKDEAGRGLDEMAASAATRNVVVP